MPFQNTFGGTEPCICGLVFYLSDLKVSSSDDDAIPVPLKNVNISTRIIDFVAEVTVTQSYVNVETNPIEAVYMFPIEEEAAVTSFEAEVDNRKIVTEVKEKDKARNDYGDAMKNHKTAVLLEETQPDIFQIKLGQLKPEAEATIKIKYVSELPVEDGKVKLTIPTTIAPRYVSPRQKSEDAKKIASIPYSSNTPAPLSVNFTGLTQCKIKNIKSPSHEFRTSIQDKPNNNGQYTYTGDLSIKTTDMDRDIILYIEAHLSEELNKPMVYLEKPDDPNSKKGLVGMVSLVPNFELDEQLTELIFLVDRSGSMGGSSIEQAKKALELFLHSLPSDCFFNIWSFGSRYEALFKKASAKYSDNTLNEALQHVRSMTSNFGGTEIYEPLQAIFKQPVPKQGYLRQIFVLTDGEVSNAPSVISLVKKNDAHGRVFSLGLGASASRYLVKGVARAGNGTAVFATEHEDLRVKVMGQLKNALQPAVSNIQISWDETAPEKGGVKEWLLGFIKPNKKQEDALSGQVPSTIPPVFDGSRLLAFYLYHSESDAPKSVKIKAESSGGALIASVDIVQTNILEGADFVRKLAAKKKIQELQESTSINEYGYEEEEPKDDVRKAITQLGVDNDLASKYTSFVGIDTNTGKTLADKPMSTREIKNQVASGFGMNFGGGFGGGMIECSYLCPPTIQHFMPQKQSACFSKGKFGSHMI